MAGSGEESPRQRRDPLDEWAHRVERLIEEARARGAFDNLPGAGKPLPDEPWAGEWAVAHHVLKQAGETLPWIALGREVAAEHDRLRAWLERTAAQLRAARGRSGWQAERRRARARYLEQAAELDRKLLSYSLCVPVGRLDRGRLPPWVAERQFDAACPP